MGVADNVGSGRNKHPLFGTVRILSLFLKKFCVVT